MTYKLPAFQEWVVAQGGLLLEPTNEWEVCRYRLPPKRVGVLYKNKKGQFSPTKHFGEDYKQFLNKTGLAPNKKVQRAQSERKRELRSAIQKRDPELCCYCGQFFTEDSPETIEHFHAIDRTGNNHEDNCGRSCKPCNVAVGNLPIVQKILLRDEIRAHVFSLPPWERYETPPKLVEACQ